MESPAGFPLPVPASAPRGPGRDGQKSESGLESGNSNPSGAKEFDQVWDQTVVDASPSRREVGSEGPDLLPPETPAENIAPVREEPPPSVAGPSPSGEVALPVENLVFPSPEKPLIQSEAGPGILPGSAFRGKGTADPAENRADLRIPTSPGPSIRPQTANAMGTAGAGAGQELRLSGPPAQNPGQRAAAPPPPVSTDLPGPLAVPAKAPPSGSLRGDAAKIAVPGRPGSADSVLSTEPSKTEVNFLSIDKQQPTVSEKRTGISAALPETDMRRPSQKSSPPTTPSPIGSRLSAGSPEGPALPVQLSSRPGGRAGMDADLIKGESTANDRIAAGSSTSESTPVLSTPSGSSSVSLAGLRQADAASVLEMVNRMADQMAARSQNRLSFTVRLEDGRNIRIRMTSDQGEIRTSFQTDLPGLETALRQQWSQFSQDAQDRGMRFQSMAFISADPGTDHRGAQSETPDQQDTFFASSPSVAIPTDSGPVSQGPKTNRLETASETPPAGSLRAWV